MIQDRLVVGLLDPNLSERLQLESDLKLVDAVQKARNSETVKSQQTTVWGAHMSATHASAPVDAVNTLHCFPKVKQSHHSHNRTGETHTAKQQRPSPSSSRKSGWCGRDPHLRECCPAKYVRCHQCSKTGHFATVCRSTARKKSSMNAVQEKSFLGAISSDVCWTRGIFANGIFVYT